MSVKKLLKRTSAAQFVFLFMGLFISGGAHAEIFSGQIHDRVQNKSLIENMPKLVFSTYKYEEPGIMTIEGPMAGVDITSTYAKSQDAFYFGGQFTYMNGEGEYNGSLNNTSTGEKTPWTENENTYFYTARAFVGKNILLDDILGDFIALSAGVGYRYLKNTGTSIYSYEREQIYYYLPITLEIARPLTNTWSLRGGVELDLLMSGENRSGKSQATEAMTFEQDAGGGSKFHITGIRHFAKNELLLEAFYQNWDIARSKPVASDRTDMNGDRLYFVEPRNKTNQLGVSVGWAL